MPKNVLILDGHPAPNSLAGALADIYGTSAEAAGHDTKTYRLHDMRFDIDFGVNRTRDGKPLEPVLQGFMEDMKWADHFVLAFPMWWGNMPGKLKGLFDRALLPGLAYDPRRPNRMGIPAPLLAGRSARVFITADTPAFVQRWIFGNALQRHLNAQILGFCGLKPVRMSYFGDIKEAKKQTIEAHLKTAESLGRAAQ
jgi:putative NADPH-quinone reductase